MALNLYDFVVRRPDRPAEKYGLRAYDEIILAPMVRIDRQSTLFSFLFSFSFSSLLQCLFEPRVIEFDSKRLGLRPYSTDVVEEIIEQHGDQVVRLRTNYNFRIADRPKPDKSDDNIHAAPDAGARSGSE